jgi:hypothetical protein
MPLSAKLLRRKIAPSHNAIAVGLRQERKLAKAPAKQRFAIAVGLRQEQLNQSAVIARLSEIPVE